MALNYDGLRFHPVDETPVDGVRTTGSYHQNGDVVWADIEGPTVRIGRLVGRVADNGVIDAGYVQLMGDGQVVHGAVVSRPSVLADGRIRLAEEWQRGDGSSGVSYIESTRPAQR